MEYKQKTLAEIKKEVIKLSSDKRNKNLPSGKRISKKFKKSITDSIENANENTLGTQPQEHQSSFEFSSTSFVSTANFQRLESKLDCLARKTMLMDLKLDDILQRFDGGTANSIFEEPLTDFQFPLKTIDDIHRCDEQLKPEAGSKARNDFIKIISMVGGKTKQNVINGILGKIFSNELSVKCSWQGKKGNFPVFSTKIIALIKDYLTNPKNGTVTEADLKTIGSDFFRFGRQRYNRETAKDE